MKGKGKGKNLFVYFTQMSTSGKRVRSDPQISRESIYSIIHPTFYKIC